MKIFLAVALLALSSGCSRSSVEIQNTTDAPITNIEVRVAGNELSIDRIEPGDSRRVGYSTKTEDTIAINFQMQGAQKQCSSKSYVSPPFEDEFTIRISSDGKCSISRKSVE
jgi:hypothetical protein